jgi:hypothetical protein
MPSTISASPTQRCEPDQSHAFYAVDDRRNVCDGHEERVVQFRAPVWPVTRNILISIGAGSKAEAYRLTATRQFFRLTPPRRDRMSCIVRASSLLRRLGDHRRGWNASRRLDSPWAANQPGVVCLLRRASPVWFLQFWLSFRSKFRRSNTSLAQRRHLDFLKHASRGRYALGTDCMRDGLHGLGISDPNPETSARILIESTSASAGADTLAGCGRAPAPAGRSTRQS